MSFTLVTLRNEDADTIEQIRKQMHESLKEEPFATLLTLNGLGTDADGIVVAFHQSYSEYGIRFFYDNDEATSTSQHSGNNEFSGQLGR